MKNAIVLLSALACVILQSTVIQAQDPPPRPREHGPRGDRPNRDRGRKPAAQRYSIEQAVSDRAQLHTIAFSGLAFITGDFGASTFVPPGKVCDYFGFQYMRDIDAGESGHNPKYLNRVAANVLHNLTAKQRSQLEALAREQAPQYRELAEKRWPLIQAFCRELKGDRPAGASGLNQAAVSRYVGDLFAQDARMSYHRAEVLGKVVGDLSAKQKEYFAKMKFGDFNSWPDVDMQEYKLPRGTEKMVNVAYMTYASELYSWYAGSLEADTYFCPERHGTYFGGFYMKDMPAMGKRDYDISTSVTGDSGEEFLNILTDEQRRHLTAIPDLQRKGLQEIVRIRRAICAELRKFLDGRTADEKAVLSLGRRYGELDGELSFHYATAFAAVNKTLTAEQRARLLKLRNLDGYVSAQAYVYSDPVRGSPKIAESNSFFVAPKSSK